MSTPYTQRVKVGAIYTDQRDLWEVIAVGQLGSVTLRGERSRAVCWLGIDAFRREMWLVREAVARG